MLDDRKGDGGQETTLDCEAGSCLCFLVHCSAYRAAEDFRVGRDAGAKFLCKRLLGIHRTAYCGWAHSTSTCQRIDEILTQGVSTSMAYCPRKG